MRDGNQEEKIPFDDIGMYEYKSSTVVKLLCSRAWTNQL